ncbi:SMP-30/gluconolactonase/LRE family protein [Ramlibacter monticola]|uniref:SMP-30/gluconolactonase/LRE family protein n=1 Tax=Ramlibacter monticola TaxID=1926872 RepID=UPI001F312A06|nr:SMP-30/gluconolactonase/LRE family protein [Ramlibacter monticola]
MSAVRLAVDAGDRLGECALWCEQAQAFWWTDIEGSKICRLQADGSVRDWQLPERVGSFAFCAGSASRLLLGLASGIAVFDTADASLSAVTPVEADQPATRINDGRCDRQGRFVFGMYNPKEEGIGGIYRVHADLRVERLALPAAAVANSICFSPDGATMYYADSPTRTIWSLAYGADGRIGTPRVFVQLGADEGYPDGSCIDAEGSLWNAQWEGRCVVRYDRDGRPTERIALPVSRPTCPAFGGPALDTLYVTSARGGLARERLREEPHAGGVFAATTRWHGLPESRFVLAR